jgi:hypothetical protein
MELRVFTRPSSNFNAFDGALEHAEATYKLQSCYREKITTGNRVDCGKRALLRAGYGRSSGPGHFFDTGHAAGGGSPTGVFNRGN